ncbi:hypothetical protein [Nocardia sp. NPDC004260]
MKWRLIEVPRKLIVEIADIDGDTVRVTDEGGHFEIRISDAHTPSTDYRCVYLRREDLETIARRVLAHMANGKE